MIFLVNSVCQVRFIFDFFQHILAGQQLFNFCKLFFFTVTVFEFFFTLIFYYLLMQLQFFAGINSTKVFCGRVPLAEEVQESSF